MTSAFKRRFLSLSRNSYLKYQRVAGFLIGKIQGLVSTTSDPKGKEGE